MRLVNLLATHLRVQVLVVCEYMMSSRRLFSSACNPWKSFSTRLQQKRGHVFSTSLSPTKNQGEEVRFR